MLFYEVLGLHIYMGISQDKITISFLTNFSCKVWNSVQCTTKTKANVVYIFVQENNQTKPHRFYLQVSSEYLQHSPSIRLWHWHNWLASHTDFQTLSVTARKFYWRCVYTFRSHSTVKHKSMINSFICLIRFKYFLLTMKINLSESSLFFWQRFF